MLNGILAAFTICWEHWFYLKLLIMSGGEFILYRLSVNQLVKLCSLDVLYGCSAIVLSCSL
uniref:Uncharacterized protein n=1 Tax=Arundo donax TaxID=35708 RepID=A0A0A9D4S8_ARUDO